MVGGIGKGGAEEGWCGDLNPGAASMQGEPRIFGCLFAMWLRTWERPCREGKG